MVRSGKIRRYKVNSRVYFLREDIEKLLFQGEQPDDETKFKKALDLVFKKDKRDKLGESCWTPIIFSR
ncbi:hypothetical protein CLV59_107382 [Chitinophaga dinghuensis]|uniref:Uncharacterized protein n=1 Tax=Chitinophaga dinghuensis TaxID=1539050 RepID=A0A327VRE2_9BACT|nr:hypothetical protein CLV59_107382 [Chitinophaga dinghuensis]